MLVKGKNNFIGLKINTKVYILKSNLVYLNQRQSIN